MYRSLPTCQILLVDVPSTPMYQECPPLDFHIVVVVLLALLAVCVAMIFISLSLFCSCECVLYHAAGWLSSVGLKNVGDEILIDAHVVAYLAFRIPIFTQCLADCSIHFDLFGQAFFHLVCDCLWVVTHLCPFVCVSVYCIRWLAGCQDRYLMARFSTSTLSLNFPSALLQSLQIQPRNSLVSWSWSSTGLTVCWQIGQVTDSGFECSRWSLARTLLWCDRQVLQVHLRRIPLASVLLIGNASSGWLTSHFLQVRTMFSILSIPSLALSSQAVCLA